MELGVGGLSKSADFANEVKNSMPELVKADRKNYSFTTLSADLNVNLDIAAQKYSIENIDGAVGGAIAKALEGITGTEIYKNPMLFRFSNRSKSASTSNCVRKSTLKITRKPVQSSN